jgi:hypothetical protein
VGDNLRRMDAHKVEEEWEAALGDAGFSNAECVLFLSDVPRKSARGAQWCEPGIEIAAKADDDLLTEQLVAELNSPEHLHRHRVIVRRVLGDDPLSVALFSAKLRHELEHARQWVDCGPPPHQLSDLADDVLRLKLVGLPGGTAFTNLKPTEQDANAASAIFLRSRFPPAVVDEILVDPDDAPLARSLTPPAPTRTLIRRMIAFLYVFEDLCAALAAKGQWTFGFAYHLDDWAPGASKLWEKLESTPLEPFWGPGGRDLPPRM